MRTEGPLLAPADFCSGRKVGGVGGLRAVEGGGTNGNAGETGDGAGLGESRGMAKTGRKGCETLSCGSEGPKSVGWIKGSPAREVRSQLCPSTGSREGASGGVMRLSGRFTEGRMFP